MSMTQSSEISASFRGAHTIDSNYADVFTRVGETPRAEGHDVEAEATIDPDELAGTDEETPVDNVTVTDEEAVTD